MFDRAINAPVTAEPMQREGITRRGSLIMKECPSVMPVRPRIPSTCPLPAIFLE